jgi:magnesium chelatase family protein
MSLAVVYSRAQLGLEAPLVTVEVHLSGGLPGLSIVGLPETAVKESKDRVRSALLNGRFEFPRGRITINLAPADLPKEGGRFDLPIALGILTASGQIPQQPGSAYEFLGELALTGELRPIRGVLPASLGSCSAGRSLILPRQNADEAGLVHGAQIYPASHLLEVCSHLTGSRAIGLHDFQPPPRPPGGYEDLRDVRGQYQAKRALEVAAAGGHNLLLIGPPGTGKTMLACRLPGILPPMNEQEALESATVRSISTFGCDLNQWGCRPFRAPHHTASGVALVGGGSHPRPGEISLAHQGVLFLDELPEFDRRVLEVLREPLESGRILISRAAHQTEFPARFQLVAAMNPCPCGYLGDGTDRCRCSPERVRQYRARISGPLLDRIDLHVEVPPLRRDMLWGRADSPGESSAQVRARVEQARARQVSRCGKPNSALQAKEIQEHCSLNAQGKKLLESAVERLGLSARSIHRVLKVARTIADLADCDQIEVPYLGEAIAYRSLDRLSLLP